MYDSIPEVIVKLKTATGLNVLYELVAKPSDRPCITYTESSKDNEISMQFGYSSISYRLKIWDNDMSNIMSKAQLIDTAMRQLGFTRTNSNDLIAGTQICKIIDYTALAKENY